MNQKYEMIWIIKKLHSTGENKFYYLTVANFRYKNCAGPHIGQAADILSLKVAFNPSIVETRTRPDHTDAGSMDMLSFKVAYNTPGKMAVVIVVSGGPWG